MASTMICGATQQDRNANRHTTASGWRRVRHGMESIAFTHRKPFAALVRIAPPFRRLRR
jgi:hypothetical protein